jgi:hypothetical protein
MIAISNGNSNSNMFVCNNSNSDNKFLKYSNSYNSRLLMQQFCSCAVVQVYVWNFDTAILLLLMSVYMCVYVFSQH